MTRQTKRRYAHEPLAAAIAHARAALRDLGRQIVASNRSAQEWDRIAELIRQANPEGIDQ